jgi:hypothetical protein
VSFEVEGLKKLRTSVAVKVDDVVQVDAGQHREYEGL